MRQLTLVLLFLTFFALNLNTHAQVSGGFELGGQILGFLHPDEMRSASMTWLKMQISLKPGGSTADAQNVINHARRHGFKVLLSIKGDKGTLAANPNQYYENYGDFVGRVALLNPDAIEVWNEPNIDVEWPAGQINGTNYTNLLKRAYPAIKAANPNVMVISGAPAPTGYFGGRCANNGCDDLIFIQQMKNAGAEAYFDCTGVHYNEGVISPTLSQGDPRGNPNHYTRYYSTMVSTYRGVFPNKPLCFTELGYLSPDGLGSLPAGFEWAANTSAQEQAQWLAQAATLSRDGGVVRLMIVWNVDANFTASNPMAGYAIIRQNNQCLPCATLAAAMSNGPQTAPTLNTPADNVVQNTAPQFTWGSVSNATGYRIEIDNNNNFSSVERSSNQSGTSYTPNPALPDGLYYWRVRGQNAEGSGVWSMARRVTIDTQAPPTPSLLTPAQNSTITDATPTFTWSASNGASRYEVRVGTTVATGTGTSYTIPGDLPIGAYSWQVRAFDAAGNASAWSTAFNFTIASPSSAAPLLNRSASASVKLTWGALAWATGYEIWVDDSPNFTTPLEHQTTVTANILEITTPSLSTGTHYWRVRAKDANNNWAAWSSVQSFQIVP